jgi:hypothetical protein
MHQKKCTDCLEMKDITEFSINKTKKDNHNYRCKVCQRRYFKRYYIKNKQRHIDRVKERITKTQKWLREYKDSLKCEKCGFDNPLALDFHHIDPIEKEMTISSIVLTGRSISRILEEITKCTVLCANCHRILHGELRA